MGVARSQLERSSGAIRLSVLDQCMTAATNKFAGVSRHLDLVHPNRPLEKGYAWVEARGTGRVVGSAEAARAAGAVRLHFGDGAVDARIDGNGARSKTYDKPAQPSLL